MTDEELPTRRLKRLPDQGTYEVGFGKPPVETRFKAGQSGNPRGRPKGSISQKPGLAEERIKTLVLEEAYRTIPILDKGRRLNIPMMRAVLRAVATNAAKGNNRAAILFTSLVERTEAANKTLASEAFSSALAYKDVWTKELARRKRLSIKLPDPIPHPDDIILDPRKMTFRIVGPMTTDELPRYKLAAEMIHAYQLANEDLGAELVASTDTAKREKLQRTIKRNEKLISDLMPHYGPRHERIKDPLVREVELIIGESFDLEDYDDDEETQD
jgi:Family of unknown function (DUF5681)